MNPDDVSVDDAILNSELRIDEGVRYSPYRDSVGIMTVGVGHNLKVSPVPSEWVYPLSNSQINQLLSQDLEIVFTGLHNKLPWWRNLSYARQRAIINMAFNMGVENLLEFVHMLAALQIKNWIEAVAQMKSSKWASQVGDRATRLEVLILKG